MSSSTAEFADFTDSVKVPWVWMYHSIAEYDCDPFEVTMTPQRLDRQLRWLDRRGLRGVSMTELLAAGATGRAHRLVGLTFDDGYQDFLTTALPILRRHGFSATVFVLAARLGGRNVWSRPGPVKDLLTADQVREIADAGQEIGSHGLKHMSLVDVDDDTLAEETQHSREILRTLTGQDIPGFCYPYGNLDERVVKAVRSAGYDYACAVGAGAGIGRHAIPRTLVHEGDTSWRLEAKRAVSALTVRRRLAVPRHRGGR